MTDVPNEEVKLEHKRNDVHVVTSMMPGMSRKDITHLNKELWNHLHHTTPESFDPTFRLSNGIQIQEASFMWMQRRTELNLQNVHKYQNKAKEKEVGVENKE